MKLTVEELRNMFATSPTVVNGPSSSGKNHQWPYLTNYEEIRKKIVTKANTAASAAHLGDHILLL